LIGHAAELLQLLLAEIVQVCLQVRQQRGAAAAPRELSRRVFAASRVHEVGGGGGGGGWVGGWALEAEVIRNVHETQEKAQQPGVLHDKAAAAAKQPLSTRGVTPRSRGQL
jgi:hypothetical protein